MTKRSFEEAQNNTGNTEGLMAPTPSYLDLQKQIKQINVCGKNS